MKFYKFVTGFVALGTAACAAYFSVVGIATLMGANFWQVAVMAGFLEAGKLVCASAAYRFRKIAPRWIRGLFITFTGIMMLITSLGIFGFLSSSYQKAASERDVNQQRVENVESKLQTFKSEVQRLKKDRQRLISEQQELQKTRAEQGWLSKRQDQRLSKIPTDLSETDSALTASRDSVLSFQTRITNLESSQNEDAKLGPIIFVANTVGLPEDSAALYFISLLILVFDPMAVTLVVALSMATDIEETVTEEQIETEGVEEDKQKSSLKKETKPDHIEEVGDEVEPQDEEKSASEVAEDLSKPLPETKGRINRMQRFANLDEESGDIRNSLRDKIPIEEVDKKASKMSEEILRKRQDEISQNKLYEEDNSRNKERGEEVEDDPFYPEEPPELDVPEKQEEETSKTAKEFIQEQEENSDEDQKPTDPLNAVEKSSPEDDEGFEEWFERASSDESQEKKPWENPFKAPFNDET